VDDYLNLTPKIYFPGGSTLLMSVYYKDDSLMFKRAVDSVFLNTLLPDKFLLVIDGSVNKKLKVVIDSLVKKYSITPIFLKKNVGLRNALNLGLKHVKTDWVIRADADDINLPNRFESQARAILKSKVPIHIIGGAIMEVDSTGRHLKLRRTQSMHHDILKYASRRNPFNHMTVVFNKEKALLCGGYPDLYLREDYGLWINMIRNGACCRNIPNILVIASAGEEMYKRRSGFRYAMGEIKLQRLLIKCGMKSLIEAFIDGAFRASAFMMPNWLKAYIDKNFLRDSF
jgi:glycosyltransferase involved in cell wall biosynthesis